MACLAEGALSTIEHRRAHQVICGKWGGLYGLGLLMYFSNALRNLKYQFWVSCENHSKFKFSPKLQFVMLSLKEII